MLRSSIFSMFVIVALTGGCAKHPKVAQSTAPAPTGPPATTAQPMAPEAARPMTVQPAPPVASPTPTTRPAPSDYVHVPEVADIHFDFDAYAIRAVDRTVLDANAAWLQSRADHIVLIEGHCDERGTVEYNVSLGDRRAKATMNYLVSRGVAARRITLVSYGEQRPACSENTETCWAKNRRAHFKVKRQ